MAEVALNVVREVPRWAQTEVADALKVAVSTVVYDNPAPKQGDVDILPLRLGDGCDVGAAVTADVRLAGNCYPCEDWVESTQYPGLLVRGPGSAEYSEDDEQTPLLHPGGRPMKRHIRALSDAVGEVMDASGVLDLKGMRNYRTGYALDVFATPYMVTGWTRVMTRSQRTREEQR